ncbi:MAG: hypothetical protein ACLQGP_39485 [Isosphaeraceae bacterium]
MSTADRQAITTWKRQRPLRPEGAEPFADRLVELVRLWAPVMPPGVVITTPPQGASAPEGPACDAAAILARLTADRLGVPFVSMLERTDQKRWHGRHYATKQAPFTATAEKALSRPAIVFVVDDLATSGTTLKLSLEAIRGVGIPAFGFAFSGV